MSTNNYNGNITNNGTFNNDCYNTNITNNFNVRINLESRSKENKTYEYTLFCLHEYKQAKNLPKNIIRVTCINVHSENMFISDHIHIDFPKKIYDEHIYNYSVMTVKAKAYKYKRKNGTYDYGLIVTKVVTAINKLGRGFEGKYGIKSLYSSKTDKDKDVRECFKYVYNNETSELALAETLTTQISYLEGIIAESCCIYSGFLYNMIMTNYFANSYKRDLENKSLYLHNLERDVLIDLLQIISNLLFKINNGEIFMWRHFMQNLNELCNVVQGIEYSITNLKNETKEYIKVNNNIKEFANKVESKENRKMFNKIKVRNEDFEYQYPKDIDKYKEQLHDYVLWFMFSQNYFDIKTYSDDWRELFNVEEI